MFLNSNKSYVFYLRLVNSRFIWIFTLTTILFIFTFLSLSVTLAQEPIIETKPDLKKITNTTAFKQHSAKKAAWLSVALPGLGQAYNKKYWKIPILYAGVAVLVYSINFNHKEYITFKDAYNLRTDGDSTTIDKFDPRYTLENLKELKKFYRRNLEFSYIIAGAVYLLNIIDASVDANLFDFDINDDLSLRVEPAMFTPFRSRTSFTGLKFTLSFK